MKTIIILLIPILFAQVLVYLMFKYMRKEVSVKNLFVSAILLTWLGTIVTGFILFEVLRSMDVFMIHRLFSYGTLVIYLTIYLILISISSGDFLACWFYITGSRIFPYRVYRERVADRLLFGGCW